MPHAGLDSVFLRRKVTLNLVQNSASSCAPPPTPAQGFSASCPVFLVSEPRVPASASQVLGHKPVPPSPVWVTLGSQPRASCRLGEPSVSSAPPSALSEHLNRPHVVLLLWRVSAVGRGRMPASPLQITPSTALSRSQRQIGWEADEMRSREAALGSS